MEELLGRCFPFGESSSCEAKRSLLDLSAVSAPSGLGGSSILSVWTSGLVWLEFNGKRWRSMKYALSGCWCLLTGGFRWMHDDFSVSLLESP
ncbi:hypothetical protein MANES_13G080480v8 [Manihot esculenta]|uniref:Uncharacterized protein n=1 Tax=Manihot esculenta TaxID=3983 RepID=A0ACB7GQ56_MANES|nr:hypothetical protein MANES_13G080480v8 [Manihot esculenta]